ncbi:MAG: MgtC/SapB family protein [Candidatus Krumholzibacteriota bacterium]|nr:MgtC/SapB family protein [Candidatus Krumholzibacteriota bacterium]
MDPSLSEFWVAVAVACFCGAAIGVERQLRGKPAGIRTSMLICLGTMVFVSLGRDVVSPTGDGTRVLGQVVTGVGFIGAGVMLAREGLIRGVTSASVIWILAAIGALAGFGRHWAAIAVALVVLAVLSGVQYLEHVIVHLKPGDYDNNSNGQDPDEG